MAPGPLWASGSVIGCDLEALCGEASSDGVTFTVTAGAPKIAPAERSESTPRPRSRAASLKKSLKLFVSAHLLRPEASGADGRLWAMVVPDYIENCMTVRNRS